MQRSDLNRPADERVARYYALPRRTWREGTRADAYESTCGYVPEHDLIPVDIYMKGGFHDR